MTLTSPFQISARLLPALNIAGVWVQLEYSRRPVHPWEARVRYRWIIDLPDGSEHTGNDLQSGAGGGNLQEGFENLLGFLEAAGESFRYRGMYGENMDLFPLSVVKWAAQHQDEIGIARLEIEENPNALVE